MADVLTTLADVVKLNDASVKDLGATDIFNDAPILNRLHVATASHGTEHKYLRETGAPVVGFRAVNAGRDRSTDSDTLVTLELKILDASFDLDLALANSHIHGPGPMMERKAKRSLRAAFSVGEKQFLYGSDADGFVGLAQLANDTADDRVVNAGGAADCSSVWMFRSTPDEAHVSLVVGKDGKIDILPYYNVDKKDGSGKTYAALSQPILGWLGLAIGSNYSFARLANVGSDAPLTDDMLSDLYEKFRETGEPNFIAMNRRSLIQLQKSRTTYSPTGTPAPFPSDWNGIPIIPTPSIGNAETPLTGAGVANATTGTI